MGNPYTADLVADQLTKATNEAGIRGTAEYEPGPDTDDMRRLIQEAFLSGCSLTANFLTRTEGQTTPQLITRALSIAGERFGMELMPAAQANAIAQPVRHTRCNVEIRQHNAAAVIPRTCAECGLGPCRYGHPK